jgi:hypothetical protein
MRSTEWAKFACSKYLLNASIWRSWCTCRRLRAAVLAWTDWLELCTGILKSIPAQVYLSQFIDLVCSQNRELTMRCIQVAATVAFTWLLVTKSWSLLVANVIQKQYHGTAAKKGQESKSRGNETELEIYLPCKFRNYGLIELFWYSLTSSRCLLQSRCKTFHLSGQTHQCVGPWKSA